MSGRRCVHRAARGATRRATIDRRGAGRETPVAPGAMDAEREKQIKQLAALAGAGKEEAVMRAVAANDTKRLQAVIASTAAAEAAAAEEAAAALAALKSVEVKREDVLFLFKEMDLTIPQADRALRRNGGSLAATLEWLLKPTAA